MVYSTIRLISIIVGSVTVVGVGSVVVVRHLDSSNKAPSYQSTISPATAQSVNTGDSGQKVTGEYWCRSYNHNGAGGSCQLQRPLILSPDGKYTFGSSSGNYTFSGDQITFSGDLSKRGPASYTTSQEIRWVFTENGAPYTITYYFRQAVQ